MTARTYESPRVSVVVPTLDEEDNLPYFFSRLPRDLIAEVVLVDGGSVDRTVEVARRLHPGLVVVRQTRSGKGNALACGFAVSSGDIIVMIDADGSTDPAEIPRFVTALLDGTDYVKGSRFRPGGDSEDITRLRKLGNAGLNGLVNLLFDTDFTDLCYGYNAFWRRTLDRLDLPDVDLAPPRGGGKLWGDGFEVETLINIRAAAHGLRIAEVASVEARRLYGTSNLNAFRDGWRVLRTILREYRRVRAERTDHQRSSPIPAAAPQPVVVRQREPHRAARVGEPEPAALAAHGEPAVAGDDR